MSKSRLRSDTGTATCTFPSRSLIMRLPCSRISGCIDRRRRVCSGKARNSSVEVSRLSLITSLAFSISVSSACNSAIASAENSERNWIACRDSGSTSWSALSHSSIQLSGAIYPRPVLSGDCIAVRMMTTRAVFYHEVEFCQCFNPPRQYPFRPLKVRSHLRLWWSVRSMTWLPNK